MAIAGIDPGITGGVCVSPSPGIYRPPVPLERKPDNTLDAIWLYHLLKKSEVETVCLEAQFKGIKIVQETGMVLAVCDLLGVHVAVIHPLAWKKLVIPEAGKAQKFAMISRCLKDGIPLPNLKPKSKKLHDGCADAYGICLYGRLIGGGNELHVLHG